MALGDDDEAPAAATVVGTLDDEQCRALLAELDEPKTASELAEAADVPLSTTYRKMGRLQAASLVDDRVQVRRSGHHRTEYVQDFDRIVLEMAADRRLDVEISRPRVEPERNLLSMWSEVREQT